MSKSQEFMLPDVGEGLTEAEIMVWHVAVGDRIAVNDLVVDIETAKSVVELPSPFAGVVEAILVDAGLTVPVGTPLIVIGTGVADDGATDPTSLPADAGPPDAIGDDDEKPQVLVGPGPKDAAARRRRLGARRPIEAPVAASDITDPVDAATAEVVPARPGARETRVPVKGVRKVTAAAMVRSAFTAPHVTEWLAVDMTRSLDLVRRLKQDRGWHEVRVTPLVVVARAFLLAVRSFPEINASWDEQGDAIVRKHYVNLGIAAATQRGLLVPNIKDAHELDLRSLAGSLASLVSTAREGRTQPSEMADGTLTITNIGALGVDAGTPILNPGESAILAFGAVRPLPWVVDGEICVREITQLAMSFDHRVVDGELGSNVLARTGQILTDPGSALVHA